MMQLQKVTTQAQANELIRKINSIDNVSSLNPVIYLQDPASKNFRALTLEMGGKKMIRIIITGIIENFLQRFEKGAKWTTDMVIELADIFIEEYPHYHLEDIQIFFYKSKRGHFGKDYNRLDYAVIFQWLAQFDEQRTQVWRDIQHNNRIREINEETKLLPYSADQKAEAEKLIESLIHDMKVANIKSNEAAYNVGADPIYVRQMKQAEGEYNRQMTAYIEKKCAETSSDSSNQIFYKHEFTHMNNRDRFIEKYFKDNFGMEISMQTKSSKV